MKRLMKCMLLSLFLFGPGLTLLGLKAFKSKKPPSADEIEAAAKAKQDAAAKKGIEDSLDNRKSRRKLVNPTGALGLSGPANVQRKTLASAS